MAGLKQLFGWTLFIGTVVATSQNTTSVSEPEVSYVKVTVSDGVLRGQEQTTNGFAKIKYYSFLGIPYAKPPVGELRFQEGQPVEPWKGVKDALKEGPNAPQKHTFFYHEVGDEDCLYLNVFSKKLSPETADLRPVMVYIHAGGFTSGSGDTEVYSPDFLLEQDIVLVTFNYRLGALGFLSLEDNKLPGNLGLKDQVLALEWVQKNIKQFGGDPNKVTIFGISAGGASVQYHLLSPLSKGLFHQAIIESGSSMNPWAYQDNPREFAIRLAKHLGYKDEPDTDKLLEFFKSVPTFTLVRGQYEVLTEKEKYHTLVLPIRPTVEKEGPGKQFITKTPREILESGNFTKVPLIIGCTNNEGNLELEVVTLNEEEIGKFNNNPNLLTPMDMQIPDSKRAEVERQVKEFYFNGKPLSWETVNNYVELFGDLTFYTALGDTLNLLLKHSKTPVYNYLLTYQNKRSFLRFMASQRYPNLVIQGTPHGDDIPLLFKQGKSFPEIPIPPKDEQTIKEIVKLWTTFAKTGNPNYEGIASTWETTKAENLKYYDMGDEFKMATGRVFENRQKFWEDLYAKYKYAY